MSIFFEIWLRGYAKDRVRELSTFNDEFFHPHITFVRPFHFSGEKKELQNIVTPLFVKTPLISYSIKGAATFDNKHLINYVPIINKKELQSFDNALESTLENEIKFYDKLSEEKILHVHVDYDKKIQPLDTTDQFMLRLTLIQDDLISHSYDFVTREILNRKESLDKQRWYATIHEFTEKVGLLPTRNGYQPIR